VWNWQKKRENAIDSRCHLTVCLLEFDCGRWLGMRPLPKLVPQRFNPISRHWTYHYFFDISTIISYHLPKKRYNNIYIISWKEWYDRISYIIFLSFQKKLKVAIFYILFINNQSSNNGHKLTSKRAVKSTQASNFWRRNLKLGQKWKMI
jgi:hypothetical protein